MRLLYLLLLVAVCCICASLRAMETFEEDNTVINRKIESCKAQQEDLKKEIEQIKVDHKNTMVRANKIRDKYNSNDEFVKKAKQLIETMNKEIDEMKPKIPDLEQKISNLKSEIEMMKNYMSGKNIPKLYPKACW